MQIVIRWLRFTSQSALLEQPELGLHCLDLQACFNVWNYFGMLIPSIGEISKL